MSMWGGINGQRHARIIRRRAAAQPALPPGTCGQRPSAWSTARCELSAGHAGPGHEGRTPRGYRKRWRDST